MRPWCSVPLARIAFALLFAFSIASPAWPAAPGGINFQGLILDATGSPVNGQEVITLAIWADPVSTAPADLIYQEIHVGVDVIDGGSFSFATVTVKLCVSDRPPTSLTRTVTALSPTCALSGVQPIRPEAGSMVMPDGAVSRLKVSVSPVSGSFASTS